MRARRLPHPFHFFLRPTVLAFANRLQFDDITCAVLPTAETQQVAILGGDALVQREELNREDLMQKT